MSALRKLTNAFYGMQAIRPNFIVKDEYYIRDGAEDVCFQVGQNGGSGAHTCGHWIMRDCGAQGFDIGLDLQSAQFGQIDHFAATGCRIGERIVPSSTGGGGNSNKHTNCRYTQSDVGILMQDAGPYPFGDNTWINTQFHQNRVCFAAVGNDLNKHLGATFIDGESEHDAGDDMPAIRDGIPRALWYWKAAGRLTIRDWNCRDDRVTDHMIIAGPAVVSIDGYNGGHSGAYLVRKVHSGATIAWYGQIAALGKAQGLSRWPDGYGITRGDPSVGISIDGNPTERVAQGFPNLALNRSIDLTLTQTPTIINSWTIHVGQYIGWVWPNVTSGPYFVGFMIENREARAQTVSIDFSNGPHDILLGAREVKRFAYYCPGRFNEPATALTGQGRVRLFGVQALWGPPSQRLQSQIDDCLREGVRDA